MLPGGTVTFLFTDVVGSTAQWEADPSAMATALAEHNTIIENIVSEFGGFVFKTVGDAYCIAYGRPEDAISSATRIHSQLELSNHSLKVRIGIHTGQVESTGDDYFGPVVNKVARIEAVANGGQTLFSQATRGLMSENLDCKDLGHHLLKDLLEPTRLWQLGSESFPEIKSLKSVPNNLPIQSTSFVGRTEEMATIRSLLQKSRLITLTGTGGTGKSRLSLQVAAEHLNQFEDGVWFCEFASLADRDDFLPTIASCLGLPANTERLRERLLSHLKSKTCLIIFDNCEHILDPASQLAEQILDQCPQTNLLVTSREPLGSRGESIFRVPSLEVPVPSGDMSLETLKDYGSTALFLERLSVIAPTYRLEKQDVARVAEICRRLDGIPLAIELAAARGRAMTLEQIENKLDDRFRLLTGGSRNALSRQQTLRALIDWSYRLLDERERAVFASLAVFSGGWDLAAAETICSKGLDQVDEFDVIDVLTALVDKSLVVFDQRLGRYHMLESLRQFGLEQLDLAPFTISIRDIHGEYYCELAKEYASTASDASRDRVSRFWAFLDNFRAAVEWLSLSEKSFNLAFSSLVDVFQAFYLLNRADEYLRLLLPLIEQAKKRDGDELVENAEIALLRATTITGHPLSIQIRTDKLAGFGERPLEYQAKWLGHIGYSLFFEGKNEESIQFLESYVGRPENPITGTSAFNTLGNAFTVNGQYQRSEFYFDRAIATSVDPVRISSIRTSALIPCVLDRRLGDALERALSLLRYIDQKDVRINGYYRATFHFFIPFTRLALEAGDLKFVSRMVAARNRTENVWNHNDPFDDLVERYFAESVADKVLPEMVAQQQKSWRVGQLQKWLESLLDLKVEDFYGDNPRIPNPHLLPYEETDF